MKKGFIFKALIVFSVYLFSVLLCVFSLPKAVAVNGALGGLTVVVDAGHGGIDGGVTGIKTGIKESDLNLTYALLLGDRLEENGFLVTQTRKTSAGLYGTTAKGFKRRDMERRKEIIQDAAPSFVISLHQNLYPSASSRGGVVFYKKGDEESKYLAFLMQERINDLYVNAGGRARTCAEGEFYILECVDCPSVLIECGFLSSPLDEKLLIDGVFQQKFVSVITSALTDYLVSA